MSINNPHKIDAQQEQQMPAAKLEESIRELIRQEMGHPPPLKPTPSKGEAAWLFLCIANAALILLLLPDALLKNDRWDTLSSLITWLSGSLFILGSVWFREFFLSLSRARAFRVAQVVLLLILLPVYISQIRPIFSIRPKIEPAEVAELEVDGIVVGTEARKELWLTLSPHTFIIKRKAGFDDEIEPDKDPNKKLKERIFEMGRWDVFRSWWREEEPYWPLLFPTTFHAGTPVTEVILQKSDYQLDPKFIKEPPPLQVTEPQQEAVISVDSRDEKHVLRYRWPFKDRPGMVIQWLPVGKYNISTRTDNCDKTDSQDFEVKKTPSERVELGIPCATSK